MAVTTAPRKIRLGVVGGDFGFYRHEHPDCIVAAVSDLRPERRKPLMEVYRQYPDPRSDSDARIE